LRELWQAFGLEPSRFDESNGVELVEQWLERLYGRATRQAVDLRGRLVRVDERRRRTLATMPRVRGIRWTPRLEQVIEELSRELPPYGSRVADRFPATRDRIR
jgi:hypothetical protein